MTLVLFTGYIKSFFYPSRKSALSLLDLIGLRKPRLATMLTALNHRLLLPFSIRNSRIVICPSEKVKSDASNYRQNKETHVLRLPIEESFYSAPPASRREKYFLVVGANEAKKNHQVIKILAQRFQNERFIIVGHQTEKISYVPENVKIRGFVDQKELISLYDNCKALIFPSLAEGHGLPVAEALARKRPVICFDIKPLNEFQHPLMRFCMPFSVDDMAEKVAAIIPGEPECNNWHSLGFPHWQEYIDCLLNVLEKSIGD
jgi:glycosyltransferase involved in cell wall biosynthesis